jgi:hypothetical protein
MCLHILWGLALSLDKKILVGDGLNLISRGGTQAELLNKTCHLRQIVSIYWFGFSIVANADN